MSLNETVHDIAAGGDEAGLLPVRHPQGELFLCDITDAALKDDMASMEHPFFAITTKPDTRKRRYENGNSWLEIVPSVNGLATIFDKDILIFAASQMMAARKAGRPISQEMILTAKDILVFTNRHTGGRDYDLLADALARLQGTQYQTNVVTGKKEERHVFSLVDSASVARDPRTRRITECRIKLSDWFFRSIDNHEVLTLHPDYFRLRKPIERRVYEIARKHCGQQLEWSIGLELLQRKSGSADTLRKFRMYIREIAERKHLLDYEVHFANDKVTFKSRKAQQKIADQGDAMGFVPDEETLHDARQVAPGWDVLELLRKWREWMALSDADLPRSPAKAFVGFCRKYYEQHGGPEEP